MSKSSAIKSEVLDRVSLVVASSINKLKFKNLLSILMVHVLKSCAPKMGACMFLLIDITVSIIDAHFKDYKAS